MKLNPSFLRKNTSGSWIMQMLTITGSQLALCGPHGVAWQRGEPLLLHPASCLCCFLVSQGLLLLPLHLPCRFCSICQPKPERIQGQLWLRCGQAPLILSDLPPVVSGAGWEDKGADPSQIAHDTVSTGGAGCPARLPWVSVLQEMSCTLWALQLQWEQPSSPTPHKSSSRLFWGGGKPLHGELDLQEKWAAASDSLSSLLCQSANDNA